MLSCLFSLPPTAFNHSAPTQMMKHCSPYCLAGVLWFLGTDNPRGVLCVVENRSLHCRINQTTLAKPQELVSVLSKGLNGAGDWQREDCQIISKKLREWITRSNHYDFKSALESCSHIFRVRLINVIGHVPPTILISKMVELSKDITDLCGSLIPVRENAFWMLPNLSLKE